MLENKAWSVLLVLFLSKNLLHCSAWLTATPSTQVMTDSFSVLMHRLPVYEPVFPLFRPGSFVSSLVAAAFLIPTDTCGSGRKKQCCAKYALSLIHI